MGSTSRPSTRIVGEPGNASSTASASVMTSRSSTCVSSPRAAMISSSSATVSSTDGHPSHQKSSTLGLTTAATVLARATFRASVGWMRAMALADFESGLALRDLPTPAPGAGELLVRIRASSLNRVDLLIAAGVLRGMMEYEFPVVPGRDFAGVVEGVGPGVERFRVGDDVLGWI